MKIWNGATEMPRGLPPFVASMGNYDGVHRGHQAILESVLRQAQRTGSPCLLITFEPHPLSVVAPERAPKLLQTRRQKLYSLERCGLTDCLILAFDAEVAQLDGEAFFRQQLAPHLSFSAIHVGDGFKFGRGRSGDVSLLRYIGAELGFEVVGVPAVVDGEITVSSSLVRRAVQDGRVDLARQLLGRPFALTGRVTCGEGRGSRLRFPTANLDAENAILPSNGVYVTTVSAQARRHQAVTNIGVRPTFGGGAVTVESHLLDFDGDLRGERLEVDFLERLRDERRFSGAEELADQIARDLAATRGYFNNLTFQV